MAKATVGIDFGGTNIKLGLVGYSGTIIDRTHLVTASYIRDKGRLIEALVRAISDLQAKRRLSRKDILGIGIGLPGLINPPRGLVNFLPNVPGWKNVPLKNILQKKTQIPTFMDNDVNLVTLGEWTFGAGRGFNNLICMTLGTGVGGGLILNGRLYRGEGFVAGELGHIPLNEKGPVCPCGGQGCFERYVGNRTLLAKARKIFKNKNIRLQDIFRLANRGDKKALWFWEETAVHIGNALVGVVNLLNPRLIIIGGGVANNYKFLRKTIQRIIKKRSMKVQGQMVKIARAQLGDDAGILGAHVLVRDAILAR